MPRAATSSVKAVPTCAASHSVWRSKRWQPEVRRPHRQLYSVRPSLLWIDDYKLGLELYCAAFKSIGFDVLTATSGEEGVKLAATHHVDVVVTDYEMPGM